MVAIDAFVYLSKHVVGVFLSYAFEEGCGKAPFVKGSSQKYEFCLSGSQFRCLIQIAR